jgi:putative MATE family efflux protein
MARSVPGEPIRGTSGVKTLLGDPKKAVIQLAWPTIVAMSVTTIYNVVDAFWVSGLGADALSALGFFFPFFFLGLALATGLGVGGGSAISRRIGAGDKEGADIVATHTIVMTFIFAAVFSVTFFVFVKDIFTIVGAGRTIGLATSYGRVMFAGATFLFFSNVANAILRSEGDARRAMVAMILGAVINIILDPIFIYTLGLGVAGAAFATILSMAISCGLLAHWLFLKGDTYVTFRLKGFRFERAVLKDIFSVGLPASVQQTSMSMTMLLFTVIIVRVTGGTDGVAVFSTGWRVVTVGTLPLLGIATAIVAVSGAAYGARQYENLKISFEHAIKIGASIEIIIMTATFILAPQIVAVFTQSEGAARIADDMTTFLRTIFLFYPAVAFGMFSSSMFQGTGRGINALLVTILRTLILGPPLAWTFAVILDMGLVGIWWGMVLGNTLGAIVAFSWARIYIHGLMKAGSQRGGSGADMPPAKAPD